MNAAAKLLEQMRAHPLDWRIDQLKTVARSCGVVRRQAGTSHVVFMAPDGRTLPVPAHRPIKPVYVRKFVQFIEVAAFGQPEE